MRASMRADGMTFCPRHTSDPAGTEDLDFRERPGGFTQRRSRCGNHETPPGGFENYFCCLGGPELLNDFVEQREWRKHVHVH